MSIQVAERSYFRVPLYDAGDKGQFVGRVVATITIANRLDEGQGLLGTFSSDQVRAVTIPDVLVDTGATTLFLPADIIAKLAVPYAEVVGFSTPAAFSRARLFRDAPVL